MTAPDLARTFRQLHQGPPLVLPNAWDGGSARIVEANGARAVATTSAGVAWAHGVPDGQHLAFGAAVDAVRRIANAVSVPVSADIESGYGAGSPDDVAEAVRAVVAAGAVGVNIEDSPGADGAPLLTADAQAARIEAARAAAHALGVGVFINARTDVFLAGVGEPAGRIDEVVRRAQEVVRAGADGIFVPGVADAETIGRLAAALDAPLNVMVGPGALPVAELAALGVARVSLGPSVALAAFARIGRVTREAVEHGTYAALDGALGFGDVDALFAGG